MIVIGWLATILLAMFGLFILGILVGPFVVAKVKTFTYRLKKWCDDEILDVNKRSEERRNRKELKRQKDFELADKKLDVKLNKVNKQIKIQTEKLRLAEDLRKQTEEQRRGINREAQIDTQRPVERFVDDNIDEDNE